MRPAWVRRNGQRELLTNFREAVRRHPSTQDALAREAGLTFSQLLYAMSGNGWISRTVVEAIAKVVEIPADELIGASIFKDQTDRYDDFDHPIKPTDDEDDQHDREMEAFKRGVREGLGYLVKEESKKDRREPTTPIKRTDRTRALCCKCGTLRTCASNRIGYEPSDGQVKGGWATDRCTRQMRCERCGDSTDHAVLRLDEDRDAAELFNLIPTQGELAQRELDELIERLAGFNVDVHYHAGWRPDSDDEDGWDGELYPLRYEWDTSKSRWRIDLDRAAPVSVLLHLLRKTWKHIAEDDFDHEWDSRTTPTICRAGETTWSNAADDLVIDLRRFMTMERERLVLDVRDQIEADA